MKNKIKQLYREKRRKRFFCVWADSYACLINLTSRNPRTRGDKCWTTLSKIIFLCFRWIGLRMRKVPAIRRSFGRVGSVCFSSQLWSCLSESHVFLKLHVMLTNHFTRSRYTSGQHRWRISRVESPKPFRFTIGTFTLDTYAWGVVLLLLRYPH